VTDAELRDAAVKHLRATTIAFPEWKRRCANPHYPAASTEWGQAFAALALIDPPAPPPVKRKGYELTLTPNWNNAADAKDVKENLNAVWVWSNDDVGYAPPNGHDPYRVLLLDPRQTDKNGKAGCDEWWIVIRREWPAGFQPLGAFETHTSFHNVASNDGPDGGVGWGFGSGVSAILFQWRPQDSTPSFGFEYVHSGGYIVAMPKPTFGVPHEYICHFVAGRTDGSTVRPGAFQITADGENVGGNGNLNTIQQAQITPGVGPFYTQRWMAAAWDGDYSRNLPAPVTTRFGLTGVGRTLDEARANVPRQVGSTFDTQAWNGKAPNVGPPTLKALP
jgi:hypothetical protein